ncbi:uncharacterized protein [Amphiura filiformis]|uniref:uncharacterized protein n=1 Tax=Amphiura filiformis TaxID=82378 RepID=UPI003B214672
MSRLFLLAFLAVVLFVVDNEAGPGHHDDDDDDEPKEPKKCYQCEWTEGSEDACSNANFDIGSTRVSKPACPDDLFCYTLTTKNAEEVEVSVIRGCDNSNSNQTMCSEDGSGPGPEEGQTLDCCDEGFCNNGGTRGFVVNLTVVVAAIILAIRTAN